MRLVDAGKVVKRLKAKRASNDVARVMLAECIAEINAAPTVEPAQRWNRLMMYLADLQFAYSPNWGSNGCGDEKLYEFVTGLFEELQGWEEGRE